MEIMSRGGNSLLSKNFIGLEPDTIYRFGNKVENLIKDIYKDFKKVNCTATLENGIFTVTSNTTSDCGIGKGFSDLLKLNKTYTIGYKLKINTSESTCKERIMICKNGGWYPVLYGLTKEITSDGTEWIDIKIKFTNTELTSTNILLGINGFKDVTFYIKEIFLVEGDYTNKKLPDIF